MVERKYCAKVNLRVLIILVSLILVLGVSLVAARQVRRSILAARDLKAGTAAYDANDWRAAARCFQEYLGRRPNDLGVLKKYARARMSIRPIESGNITQAIAGYRRVIQLDPLDEVACEELIELYTALGHSGEVAYLAGKRLEREPNDPTATLRLAESLINQDKKTDANEVLGRFMRTFSPGIVAGRRAEYVRACGLMGGLVPAEDSNASARTLTWLNRAVTEVPDAPEAYVQRAWFYLTTPEIPGLTRDVQRQRAGEDLEAADKLGSTDPRIRERLCEQWLALEEWDKAAAELQAVEGLTEEELERYFFDPRSWTVARFLLESKLAIGRRDTARAAPLADGVLASLTEKARRSQVLPAAILLYCAADKPVEARRGLAEYLDLLTTMPGAGESRLELARLKAMVARTEQRPFLVIDVLHPVLENNPSHAELWQLAAEAYSQTDQPRRAVAALTQYLRFRPQDPQVCMQLAREYLKLRDWSKALEVVRLAESVNPTDIVLRLLRMESGVYLAAGQPQGIDKAKFEPISAELAQLRNEHPDQVNIRLLQAAVATYLEQPDQAERELKLAIQECKEPLRAEMALAGHYSRMKRMADALEVCRAACERHGEVAEPWLALSSLHAANGDIEAGRRCLRQGIETAVGPWEQRSLSIRLALLELMQGDRAAGISLLRSLAAQHLHDVYIRTLLLGTREVLADPALAAQLVAELRQIEGESGVWWRLHQASLWLSEPQWQSKQQEVAGLLQYCSTVDPEWSAPVSLLADLYQKQGDLGRMEEICWQALARNPAATDIADRLISLLEKQGRHSDAQKVLQQVEMEPRIAGAWRIRMALQADDFSRAIDELKLRVSNDNLDFQSRILLARLIYWQTRDANQAFAYLKEAEAMAPDSLALIGVKAAILRAEGRKEEAQGILSDYVTKQDSFHAYSLRAAYLDREGERERAEADYRKLTTFADQGVTGYELLADFYARRQELDKAVGTLEEGLKAYPANPLLQRARMRFLLLRGFAQDREQALGILMTLEQQLPQDPGLMKVRAAILLEEATPQSMAAAREKLESVVKLEPAATDAHLALIDMAMQERDYGRARDYAIRALGSNASDPELILARARAEFALENTRMAADLARLVLQSDPNSAGAIEVLLRAGRERNDLVLLSETRKLVDAAMGRNPNHEKLQIIRAHVYTGLETPQAAIPELQAYCQTPEGSHRPAALATLADLYRLAGDPSQAGEWIDKAERLAPDNQIVIHARVIWLISQKRFDDLTHISARYISAKDQDMSILLNAASALIALDVPELKREGLKLFEHAMAVSPMSLEARLGMASSLYQMGNADGAQKLYRQLLEQYPNDVRILNDLAWILQEHYQRYAEALGFADRGLNLSPRYLHLLDTRAAILMKMPDRLADARKDVETIADLSGTDLRRQTKSLLQLGRICVKLNDLAAAKQYLQRALEADQKSNILTPEEESEIIGIIR